MLRATNQADSAPPPSLSIFTKSVSRSSVHFKSENLFQSSKLRDSTKVNKARQHHILLFYSLAHLVYFWQFSDIAQTKYYFFPHFKPSLQDSFLSIMSGFTKKNFNI